MKQTFEIPDGCNRVIIEQCGNRIVTTFEPEFKDGDVILTRWEDHNAICILKGVYSGDAEPLYSYASLSSQTGYGEDRDIGTLANRLDRPAAESEKKQLWEAMAKENKQWNAEKKCIEDLKPKRWRAEDGVYYWYLDSRLHKNESAELGSYYDELRYSRGNYFQTRKQACDAAEKIKELLKRINP